jgi:Spy/CpxP family protein refolding chaperone
MLQKELGLSDQQAGELKKMWSDERKESVRRRADLRIARMELEELLDAPTVDEKAVAAKVKAVTDLQAAELKSRTDRRLAVKRILTPEQQQKMKELRREHARGAREGRAWRRGRPGTRRPAMGPGGPGPGGLPDDDDAMDEPAAPLER